MNDDTAIIEALRQAHASAPAAPIDAATVLEAGRRRRRRTRAARWSGTAAALGVLVVTAGVVTGPQHAQTPVAAAPFTEVTILDTYRGVPEGVPNPWSHPPEERIETPPFVDLEARTLTLWTGGSSTCPNEPKRIRAEGAVIEVVVGIPDGVLACTMEATLTTYVLAFPPGYEPTQRPTVHLVYEELPGPGADRADADLRPALITAWAESGGEDFAFYCPAKFEGPWEDSPQLEWGWDGKFHDGVHQNIDPGILPTPPAVPDGTPVDVAVVTLGDGRVYHIEVLQTDDMLCVAGAIPDDLRAPADGPPEQGPGRPAAAPPTRFSETELLALGTRVWDEATKDGLNIQRVGVDEERQVVWFSGPGLTEDSTEAAALRESVGAKSDGALSVKIVPYEARIQVLTGRALQRPSS